MALGTSSARTIVTSMRIAIARPKPNCCRPTIEPATKPMNAANMISPAAVTMRPVLARPSETAFTLSCVRSHSSRMRLTRKTS